VYAEVDDNMTNNNKEELIRRLNRIKGQIEGILRMVDRSKSDMDIFTQVTAAKKALDSTGRHVLEKYISENFSSVSRSKQESDKVKEILEIMGKF
jgi:DNA-binding FrmR family transcriptional regulator